MNQNRMTYLIVAIVAFALAACSPQPTPTAVPTQQPHACTVTVKSGDGWSMVFGKLGYDYYRDTLPAVRINGVEMQPKGYALHAGDVVSLVAGTNCVGLYNQAVKVSFDDATIRALKGEWTDMGGFTKRITPQAQIVDGIFTKGVQETLHTLCARVALKYGGYQISSISNGCNYATVAKASYADGHLSCTVYLDVPSANDALARMDLDSIKSLALAVLSNATEQEKDALCNR